MASKLLVTFETIVKPTITLAGLGTGAGRISAVVDNTSIRAASAHIWLQIMTGTAPNANTAVKCYIINRSNDGTNDIPDGDLYTVSSILPTTDTGVAAEPTNAECLGSIMVDATANKYYRKRFVAYDLSPKFGVLVWNNIGQSLNATGSNFDLQVQLITPEAQ